MTGGSCARGLGHASVGISDLGPMGTCHVAQVAVSTTCPDGHGLSIYYNKCREPVWVLEITRAVNSKEQVDWLMIQQVRTPCAHISNRVEYISCNYLHCVYMYIKIQSAVHVYLIGKSVSHTVAFLVES